MPLTRKINFKGELKKRNIVQIPQLYRWQYKLETCQILKVTVNVAGAWAFKETFLNRLRKDGRLTIPQIVISRLKRGEPSLEDYDMEISIVPA